MNFLVLTMPPLVWAAALAWMAAWLVSAMRHRPRAARLPGGIALAQLAGAGAALSLTAMDQTGRPACMLGIGGMAVNAGLFLIGSVVLVILLILARQRLEAVGGAVVPIAAVLTSWLAALVHMRSALFCTL